MWLGEVFFCTYSYALLSLTAVWGTKWGNTGADLPSTFLVPFTAPGAVSSVALQRTLLRPQPGLTPGTEELTVKPHFGSRSTLEPPRTVRPGSPSRPFAAGSSSSIEPGLWCTDGHCLLIMQLPIYVIRMDIHRSVVTRMVTREYTPMPITYQPKFTDRGTTIILVSICHCGAMLLTHFRCWHLLFSLLHQSITSDPITRFHCTIIRYFNATYN